MNDTLSGGILTVLKKWGVPNGDFDGMWHGYESLQDELAELGHKVSLREIKCEMKSLSKDGKVEMLPIYDCDFILSGRGWFIK